jgi:hypothetical protein
VVVEVKVADAAPMHLTRLRNMRRLGIETLLEYLNRDSVDQLGPDILAALRCWDCLRRCHRRRRRVVGFGWVRLGGVFFRMRASCTLGKGKQTTCGPQPYIVEWAC